MFYIFSWKKTPHYEAPKHFQHLQEWAPKRMQQFAACLQNRFLCIRLTNRFFGAVSNLYAEYVFNKFGCKRNAETERL